MACKRLMPVPLALFPNLDKMEFPFYHSRIKIKLFQVFTFLLGATAHKFLALYLKISKAS